MITRGIYIGKIVDDLANLKYQIDLRNKLGQFDLSKFCEDFFREVLNITYNYNLSNLNNIRTNNPGLDLGDTNKGIAFQITSQNSSEKIKNTLQAITNDQKKTFKDIFILIIGNRQNSYTISETLCKAYNFEVSTNLMDINSLLRDIVVLEIDQLDILFSLFTKEFRKVKIELELLDNQGNFESSYYNVIERKPSLPPINALKFLGPKDDSYHKQLKKLISIYENLGSVPRVTRELLSIIVDRGKYGPTYQHPNRHGILPNILQKILRLNEAELLIEVNILEDAGLASFDIGEVGERDVKYLVIDPPQLNDLFFWMKENKLSIRNLLNTMDFSVLDE